MDCELTDVCDHKDDTSGAPNLFARSPIRAAIAAAAAAAIAGVVGFLAPAAFGVAV